MGFFLQVEVDSLLSAAEFRERVIVPLAEGLERECLGRVIEGETEASEGVYELALEVSDQGRARDLVEEILKSLDA